MEYLMVRPLNFGSLKISLFFLLVFALFRCPAQQLHPIDSATINSPDLIGADKNGDIYISDIKGNLHRFDSSLNVEIVYSPSTPARITSFDPWMGLRIFLFYQDIQEFAFLNRFLDSRSNHKLPEKEARFVMAATPSYDNKLWLLDQPTMSLIKYDYLNQQMEFQQPLDMIITGRLQNILLFREYQNRIYLAVKEGGLYVFDNLGNFILKKEIPKINGIDFFKDSMYYHSDGKLITVDLYSFDPVEEIALPPFKEMKKIVRTEDKIHVLTAGRIYSFRYP